MLRVRVDACIECQSLTGICATHTKSYSDARELVTKQMADILQDSEVSPQCVRVPVCASTFESSLLKHHANVHNIYILTHAVHASPLAQGLHESGDEAERLDLSSYFAACMDTERVNALGASPMMPLLSKIGVCDLYRRNRALWMRLLYSTYSGRLA